MASSATANPPKSLSQAETSRKERRQAVYRPRLAYVIAGICGFLLMIVVYLQFAYVSGLEINNQTWQMRSFSFYRDPLTNFQWTGISRDATTDRPPWKAVGKQNVLNNAIATHLRTDFDFPASWDLVRFERGSNSARPALLVELLTAVNADYRPFWSIWSKQHPDLAAVFWPAIQDLSVANMYAYMPTLFQLPLADLSADELQAKIEDCMHDATLERAKLLLRQSRPDDALESVELGLRYGDHRELQALYEQLAANHQHES